MSYRNFFGLLCLLCFVAGLVTESPYAYWGALFTGALGRTSVRKGWKTPPWLEKLRLPWRETPSFEGNSEGNGEEVIDKSA